MSMSIDDNDNDKDADAGPAERSRWADWRRRQYLRAYIEHWRIGIIDAPIHTLLVPGPLPPIQWITPLATDGYWADPFGLPGDPRTVFAERYDERTRLGTIERLELVGDRLVPRGRVEVDGETGERRQIGRGLHSSFPNIFDVDGQLYALPETSAARECVLYRVDADGRWHSPVTILRDVGAADPVIFRWHGRFWLAYADTDIGSQDTLCLAHADRIEGPWEPHRGPPLLRDKGGARLAGRFFEHDGVLYRPGQDCRATYGAATVLYRVDECSATRYRETRLRVLAPDPHGPLPHGLHTLSAWGDRTLVDGKRMILNKPVLSRRVAARLGRMLRK